jgi:hypothetical protein
MDKSSGENDTTQTTSLALALLANFFALTEQFPTGSPATPTPLFLKRRLIKICAWVMSTKCITINVPNL